VSAKSIGRGKGRGRFDLINDCLSGDFGLQFLDQIELLPREAAIGVRLAAEVAVGRSARVNRLVQAEMLTNTAGVSFITFRTAFSSASSETWPVPCVST